MKIVKYELSLVHKKELILTMEDDVDSEDLLKIFLETQVKEEKEQDGLIGIIAEKVSEESCTEQCESCQKYCPASEECMATDENVYTIPASNAFGLPHRFPVCQSSGSLSGRIPETLRKIYNMEKQET